MRCSAVAGAWVSPRSPEDTRLTKPPPQSDQPAAHPPAAPRRSYDARIPLLVFIPVVAIALVWFWGFRPEEAAGAVSGRFELGPGIRLVKLYSEMGNIDVSVGPPGRVVYTGKTLRVTKDAALLARAVAAPFDFVRDTSAPADQLVLRVSPFPEGFQPVHQRSTNGDTAPKDPRPTLFRQIDLEVQIPVDVAVEVEAKQSHVRIDTRQAPTRVKSAGTMVLLHTAAALDVTNVDGSTMIEQHRGPLVVHAKGKTRVTFLEVVAPATIVNALGEVDLMLPRHASFTVDARSVTGKVVSAFPLTKSKLGERGMRAQGTVGSAGGPTLDIESQNGTLTLRASKSK